MANFENSQSPNISLGDILVKVEFVANTYTERILMTAEQASNTELLERIAATRKQHSGDEVVIAVGFDN